MFWGAYYFHHTDMYQGNKGFFWTCLMLLKATMDGCVRMQASFVAIYSIRFSFLD